MTVRTEDARNENDLSLSFARICDLIQARGEAPIKDTIWRAEVGAWAIALNGFAAEQENIPAFTARIEFNGWPAGLIDPYGGVIAAGAVANEESFVEALDAAIAKARGET